MLNLEDILDRYPSHIKEGHERDIIKEYLQYHILDSIYQTSIGKKLCFIGGTALRLLHDNQRFSEDLDFDNRGLTYDEFIKLEDHIIQEFALQDIDAQVKPIQKKAFHLYIKLPRILYDQGLSPHTTENITIRIDTHDQGLQYERDQQLLKKFEVGRVINTAPLSVIMAMKIITITQRPRAKGRDYFDLIFLMNKNVQPDFSILEQVKGVSSNEQIQSLVVDTWRSKDPKKLRKDVRRFLFNPHDDSILHFGTYVENYNFTKNN